MDFFNDDSMAKALEEQDKNAAIEPEMTGTTEKPETVNTTEGDKVPLGLLGKRAEEPSATDMNPDVKKQKLKDSYSEDVATAAPPQANKMDFFNDDSMAKALEQNEEKAATEVEMAGTTEEPETENTTEGAEEPSATGMQPDQKKLKDVADAAPPQADENKKQIKVEVNSPKSPPGTSNMQKYPVASLAPASPKGVSNYSFYASEVNWEDDSEDEEVFNRYTLKPKKKN